MWNRTERGSNSSLLEIDTGANKAGGGPFGRVFILGPPPGSFGSRMAQSEEVRVVGVRTV